MKIEKRRCPICGNLFPKQGKRLYCTTECARVAHINKTLEGYRRKTSMAQRMSFASIIFPGLSAGAAKHSFKLLNLAREGRLPT